MVDSAGIAMTFSEKFFKQHQSSVVKYLSEHMNGFTIPDSAPEFSFGKPKVVISLKKQRLIYFKIQDFMRKEEANAAEIKIIR